MNFSRLTLSRQEFLQRIQELELNDYDDDEFDADDASSDEDIVMINESSGDSMVKLRATVVIEKVLQMKTWMVK